MLRREAALTQRDHLGVAQGDDTFKWTQITEVDLDDGAADHHQSGRDDPEVSCQSSAPQPTHQTPAVHLSHTAK